MKNYLPQVNRIVPFSWIVLITHLSLGSEDCNFLLTPQCSVQFNLSVVSNSLQPHGLQNSRLPCPSPTPGVYSNSCPSSQWCHPTIISSSVVPFSSCLQSFPASVQFSSVAQLCPTLWHHGLHHASPPCPSPIPGVHSKSCLSSWWCHPTISFSVITSSAHLQSFPISGSFQMSQLFASGDQSTGVSASTLVLPMNTQDWLDLRAVQGTLKSLLQDHSSKASILQHSAFFIVELSHPYMTIEKP